ncbi:MAG: ribonuclease H-like domain-containing protein [Candidatus Limnocylindrales bacterium]
MTTTGSLLESHLDRLRRLRPAVNTSGPVARHRQARAQQLADSLGGWVERGEAGAVVVLETRLTLPLAAERLASLPYHFDPSCPLVCLDTETTGLGTGTGTLAFLAGLGWWEGDTYRLRQMILPDHADEPAFLSAVQSSIPPDAWLVTYNGRGFDWPLLLTRFRLHARPEPVTAGHLDLLPIARQLWRHRLGDARLRTVEAGVAGVRRRHDLPGALIPARYFAYLRTGRGDLLSEVARHNRQDVLSLALLLARLSERFAAGGDRAGAHPGDLAALGRAFVRRRRYEEALECYEGALESAARRPWEAASSVWRPFRSEAGGTPLVDRLCSDRARVLARMGRRAEAAASWTALAEDGGSLAALSWIELAKHREHVERDLPGALEAARRAARMAERARLTGRPRLEVERDLRSRLPRLRGRLGRSSVPGVRLTGWAPAGPGAAELIEPFSHRPGIGQAR